MIYAVSATGVTFIILEPGNLERLKAGAPIAGPDGKVFLLYTPDIVKFADRLKENDLDFSTLPEILEECKDLPEVRRRDNMVQILGKKDQYAN